MPVDLPRPMPDRLADRASQAALLSDAFATGDPMLVSLALKEIASASRLPGTWADDPALSAVLAAIEALSFDVTVTPRA